MTNLRPLETTRVNEQVYEAIQEAIVHCELEPGSLIGDRQLAEVFSVSRTPVRDALHRLESTGLVERRGRLGWLVTSVSGTDLSELFELRCLLEPRGLERLFEDHNAQERLKVASMFDGFRGRLSDQDIEEYLRVDNRFHEAIIRASSNSRIIRFYEVIEKQIDRGRHYLSYGLEGRVHHSLEEHREICSALKAEDLGKTTAALTNHLRNADKAMHEMLQKRQIESCASE